METWPATLRSVDALILQGLRPDLRSVNLALRAASWGAALQLLRRLTVWNLRATTVTFNSCLRSGWPWYRGCSHLAMMATCLVEVDVITCNAGIAETGPWPRALAMFDSFRRSMVQADTITFNSLLSKVWTLAGQLLLMRGHSLQATIVSHNTNIHACEGDWQMSLDFLHQMLSDRSVLPDTISFGSSISGCGRAARWRGAMNLLADVPSRRLPVSVVAVNSAIAAGPWQSSNGLLQKCHGNVVSYNALAAASEKASLWTRTLSVLAALRLRGFRRNLVMCNTAISACEACSVWFAAEALLYSTPLADVMSFNAALSACSWMRALEIFGRLCRSGLKASVVTLNSSIVACGPRWPRAILLLGDVADAVTCNAIINACNSWQKARGLLGIMLDRRCQSNAVSCSTLISSCGSQWRTSLQLLEDLKRQKVVANEVAYSAVISSCEQGEDWRVALAVLGCMQDLALLANAVAINAAISACAKCIRWKEALCLLDASRVARQDDVVSYSAAISAMSSSMQWALAQRVFAMLDDEPDLQCCNSLLWALANATQGQKALEMQSTLELYQLRGNAITLSACISACERSDRCQELQPLLAALDEQMLQDALEAKLLLQ